MRQVTIALAQMNPVLDDVSQNLDTMVKLVEDVSLQHKIDLIVFPELVTTGYECGVRFADLAERVADHTVNTLAKCAAEHDVHIVFGMAEKQKVESVIYSAAVMVDPDGEVVADYQKVHLKGEQRLTFRPGYRYVTAETRLGVVGCCWGGTWLSPRRREIWRWPAPSWCASVGAGRRPMPTSGAVLPLPGLRECRVRGCV